MEEYYKFGLVHNYNIILLVITQVRSVIYDMGIEDAFRQFPHRIHIFILQHKKVKEVPFSSYKHQEPKIYSQISCYLFQVSGTITQKV